MQLTLIHLALILDVGREEAESHGQEAAALTLKAMTDEAIRLTRETSTDRRGAHMNRFRELTSRHGF